MTLKQLEAFYWAATCINFVMAAERVHLSVSSLSKRIAELESALGRPLFNRTGHKASLTSAGEHLLPLAAELLQRADHIRTAIGTTVGLHGVCRLGVGELSSVTWMPEWVAVLRTDHPALSIDVTVDIGDNLARRLERGEIDAAVIAGRAVRPNLQSTPLSAAEFVWCAAPSLARDIHLLDVNAWRTQTMVTLPRGSGVTYVVDDWMRRANARPAHTLQCGHWGAVTALIVRGLGVGLLPVGWAHSLQRRQLGQILESHHQLAPLSYEFHTRHDDVRPMTHILRATSLISADFNLPGPSL